MSMSREKAKEYLRLAKFKDKMLEQIIKTSSMFIQDVPPAVLTEVFMDLDYSEIEDMIADIFSETFDDEELDTIIDFAKQPIFQKFLDIQSGIDFRVIGKVWHNANREAIVQNIKRVFPMRGIPQHITNDFVTAWSVE